MEFYTYNGQKMLVLRNKAGKIQKVYSGRIALVKFQELFNPFNLN